MKALLRGRRLWLVVIAVLWVSLILITSPGWLILFLAGLTTLIIAGVLAMRRSSKTVHSLSPVAAILGVAMLGGSWWVGTGPTEPPMVATPATSVAPTVSTTPSAARSTSAPATTPTPSPTPSSTAPSSASQTPSPTPPSVEPTLSQEPTTTAPVIVEPTKDVCPRGDWTGDRYDRRCGTPPPTQAPEPTVTVTSEAPTTVAPTTTAPVTTAPATTVPAASPAPDKCGFLGDQSGDPYDRTCHKKIPGPPSTSP